MYVCIHIHHACIFFCQCLYACLCLVCCTHIHTYAYILLHRTCPYIPYVPSYQKNVYTCIHVETYMHIHASKHVLITDIFLACKHVHACMFMFVRDIIYICLYIPMCVCLFIHANITFAYMPYHQHTCLMHTHTNEFRDSFERLCQGSHSITTFMLNQVVPVCCVRASEWCHCWWHSTWSVQPTNYMHATRVLCGLHRAWHERP
jgi:hypothetical protein